MKTRWYRGLPYDANRPLDKEEGAGWLAQDVTLRGIVVPAGTKVFRDIDSEEVWVRLEEPVKLGALVLPTGSRIIIKAKPRAWWEWIAWLLWTVPMVIIWSLVVGLVELFRGTWRPFSKSEFERSHPPGKKLAYVAWPGEVIEIDGVEVGHNPSDCVFHYRDGTVRAMLSSQGS